MPILIDNIENLLIPSNAYFVRINKYPGYQTIIEEFEEFDNIISCLAVEHRGNKSENPHFHLCIHTDQKAQAIRKWLKSKFTEGKGNAHMSIKDWDKNAKVIQYCFHEDKTQIILHKGYSIKFIKAQEAAARLFENEKKTYTSKLEEKTIVLIQQAICAKEELLEHRFIVYKIWDCCRTENLRFPNKFMVDGLVQSIQSKLSQGENNLIDYAELKKNWYHIMFPTY